MTHQNQSPLDAYRLEVEHFLREQPSATPTQVVRYLHQHYEFSTSDKSVSRAFRRWGIAQDEREAVLRKDEQPSFRQEGDVIDISSGRVESFPSPEQLIVFHGLDPEEWTYDKPIVSWWGDPTKKSAQLKLKLHRKVPMDFVIPARVDGSYVAPRSDPKDLKFWGDEPKMWIVAGDQQAPQVDWDLHAALVGFISSYRPHGMVNLGDLIDLPTVSRHNDNPEWDTTVQEGIDAGYQILYDYRKAYEDMEMVFLPGNHDQRLRSEILNRAERMYGIRSGKLKDEPDALPALSLVNLLRLDELNIEYIDPNGEYEQAQYALGPDIAVRHGAHTGPNAPVKMIERLTHSALMGHTHHQSLRRRTIYDLQGNRKTITAVETGCLCRIDGGLGYAVQPDWQAGFATVEIWPDGRHQIDLATWDGEALLWRNERFF